MAPRTGFYLHPSSPLHDTGWRHPEHQGRLRGLSAAVEKATPELLGRLDPREVQDAGEDIEEALRRVHTVEHLDRVRAAVERAKTEGTRVTLDADTVVSAASWDAASGSSSAVLTACREVAGGSVDNAFVAARPPGHHATPGRAMGFCLVNHVAVAARWLQATGRAERVAIVDWDVHHGNGTQDAFYDDASVFYLSLHQSPHYPGTGPAAETGSGAGKGRTLNVPLPVDTPVERYHQAFEDALARLRASFQADFLLVSAGFDVLRGDPLGGQRLEPRDLGRITGRLLEWAREDMRGRVVAVLEGGYVPERLGHGTVEVLRALTGLHDESIDPEGAPGV